MGICWPGKLPDSAHTARWNCRIDQRNNGSMEKRKSVANCAERHMSATSAEHRAGKLERRSGGPLPAGVGFGVRPNRRHAFRASGPISTRSCKPHRYGSPFATNTALLAHARREERGRCRVLHQDVFP